MAASSDAPAENGAPSEQRGGEAPSDSKRDAAAASEPTVPDGADEGARDGAGKAEGGPAGAGEERGGKRGAAGAGKKRGDKGRAAWSREQQESKKRGKQDDWRDLKRRKVNAQGDAVAGQTFSKEEIAAEQRRPKRKVAVMIGYAGTGYRGMQVNGDEPTIERDLFRAFIAAKAISKANADDPRKSSLARCARTDKGVHAAGNVISLKLIVEDDDVVDRINAALPDQIRVWGVQRTNNSFNCYQYCDSRWYEYLMPSYCLLPPHPQTYLGRRVAELAREHGAEAELDAAVADVAGFWADVEDKEVKPILAALDPEVRAAVLERVHVSESEAEATGGAANMAETETQSTSEATGGAANVTETETQSTSEAPGVAPAAEPGRQGAQAATLNSVKPKHRDLGPVDYALRDIKATYIAAKRRYRIGAARLQRLQAALDKYVGTNNFHNYTVQKAFTDPSARRHIKSFVVNPKPIIIGDTEWLSLKVHGQSFMMHQIRKMVGMASLLVRCGTTLDRVAESYGEHKIAIPKAPGLGLLLERPVFDNYNRRAHDSLGRPEIDFAKYEERLQAFKDKQIYTRIFDVEERENTFHAFFNQIDQFKSNHFLWLSAGGLAVAELKGASKAQDVDRELGDEDEDPEGGEG